MVTVSKGSNAKARETYGSMDVPLNGKRRCPSSAPNTSFVSTTTAMPMPPGCDGQPPSGYTLTTKAPLAYDALATQYPPVDSRGLSVPARYTGAYVAESMPISKYTSVCESSLAAFSCVVRLMETVMGSVVPTIGVPLLL